jgi:hypothetical protein
MTLVLFIVGLVGNGLSMIILLESHLRCLRVYHNLFLLCGWNIFYLFAVLLRHTNIYGQDIRDKSFDLCRLHVFIVAYAGHLCSWQLVMMSIQRVQVLLSLRTHRTASWVRIKILQSLKY